MHNVTIIIIIIIIIIMLLITLIICSRAAELAKNIFHLCCSSCSGTDGLHPFANPYLIIFLNIINILLIIIFVIVTSILMIANINCIDTDTLCQSGNSSHHSKAYVLKKKVCNN